MTYTQACDHAGVLERSGATHISITETSDGYDVTWWQP